jgi:putative transposase
LRPSLESAQYLSASYTGLLAEHGARSSVGRPGTCYDNAAAESFFATLKTELLHRATWPTRQQARTAIFDYIETFYNRHRLHSTLELPQSGSVRGATLCRYPGPLTKPSTGTVKI